MWRKNRNPTNHVTCGTDNDIGNGIDLNRNFDFVWGSKFSKSKYVYMPFFLLKL